MTILCLVATLLSSSTAYNAARFGAMARKMTAGAIVASGFALTGAQEISRVNWIDVVPAAHALQAKSVFEGEFTDPNHPGGMRKITVKGNDVTLTGTDSPGGKQWVLKAKEDLGTIFVDFSPKGGPSNLLGVYDADAAGKGQGGITWPDGNVWAKK